MLFNTCIIIIIKQLLDKAMVDIKIYSLETRLNKFDETE